MTFDTITSVSAQDNYELRLVYSDGIEIIADFKPIINQDGVFKTLADPQFFSQVAIGDEGRYIGWPGDIDFCADALRLESHPEGSTEKPTIPASSHS